MFVVIHHEIKDATRFWEHVGNTPPAPDGLRNVGFYPAADNTAAFCLYEADSLEALRQYVDGGLGESSVQSYYVVNAELAAGIPA